MARVFLSYRRADGRYAVGWIAERLRRLDEVTDLRSAFDDSDLRCGDDFPAALATEIENCDLFIAVIGPNWLGIRADGTRRILDESDWVGREVSGALVANKRVLPVLLDGIEPLNRSDLPEHLAALADRNALQFAGEADLDLLESHVRSHLEEIDRERARIAGLEEPIPLSSFRVGPLVIAAALLAAVIGAAAGFALTQAFVGDGEKVPILQANDTLWTVASMVQIALWGALGTVGFYYLWAHFRTLVRIRWRPVVLSFLITGLLLAWLIAVFGTEPPVAWGAARIWASLALALVLLAPWILILLGAAWTTPTIPRHELGERARLIGQLDRISWVATAVLCVASLPAIAVTVGAGRAFDAAQVGDPTQSLVIPFAALLTAAIVALLVQSRAELRNDSTALALDMAGIAANLRKHGEAVLVTRLIDLQQWWLLIWLALPITFAIVLDATV